MKLQLEEVERKRKRDLEGKLLTPMPGFEFEEVDAHKAIERRTELCSS
jgi:hypothetical protein